MCEPRAADRVQAKRLGPFRRLLRTTQRDAADGLAVEEPLQRRERIVGGDAMSVGAGANGDADLLRGDNGRRAARRRLTDRLAEGLAAEVHRVLHGPPDAE